MITETNDQLQMEIEELRRRLEEAEDALRAIRSGDVDAVLVEADHDQVYTLETADKPYRLLVEQMPQGAATLTVEGTILYGNRRFVDLLKHPLQSLLGRPIQEFAAPQSRSRLEALLSEGRSGEVQGEINLLRSDGTTAPVNLGVNALREGALGLCLVVTDLTEQAARHKAERLAERIARLQAVTAALSEALTVSDVADVIVSHGLTAINANVAVVSMLANDGKEFVNLRVVGYPPELTKAWTRFSADARLPMVDAVRQGCPIVLSTVFEQHARYPELKGWKAIEGDGALVALPLIVHGRAIGALRLAFPKPKSFSAEDIADMVTLAQQCAQALERARLHDAERLARAQAEQEVDERKRVEHALRQSEEHFRRLVEGVRDYAILMLDPKGRVATWNPGAERITGYRAEDILGQHFSQFHTAVDLQAGKPVRELQIAAAEGKYEDEGWRIRKDGTRFWANILLSTVHDDAGQIVGFAKVVRDTTERRLGDERFRSVVNHVVDGIITIDERATVQTINPAAEKLFGYEAGEIVGRNIRTLMPEPYRTDNEDYVSNYIRTGQARITAGGREVEGRRKDGSTFPMELAVSEFQVSNRRFFTGIVRDITERKRVDAELRRQSEQLAAADRRKDEFLATLAHELRNPLAAVKNAVELNRRAEGNLELIEETRGMMDRQLDHMMRLVDDLLDVSRITEKKIHLRKEKIELARVIQSAVDINRPHFAAYPRQLTVDLPKEPVWLDADPVRLTQVFSNLLNNAAKYTRDGGRISLTASLAEQRVVVIIQDNGIGISPEMLPRVFEIFTQAKPALMRSQGGLGIGLSLARALVELHGGSIEARSDGPGRGSEFAVRLPVFFESQSHHPLE
jgi:PAS domain S-box-containing protein